MQRISSCHGRKQARRCSESLNLTEPGKKFTRGRTSWLARRADADQSGYCVPTMAFELLPRRPSGVVYLSLHFWGLARQRTTGLGSTHCSDEGSKKACQMFYVTAFVMQWATSSRPATRRPRDQVLVGFVDNEARRRPLTGRTDPPAILSIQYCHESRQRRFVRDFQRQVRRDVLSKAPWPVMLINIHATHPGAECTKAPQLGQADCPENIVGFLLTKNAPSVGDGTLAVVPAWKYRRASSVSSP